VVLRAAPVTANPAGGEVQSHRPGITVLLASASPARLGVLRTAGLDPLVTVSGVDEDAVLAASTGREPAARITGLAEAKADAVVSRIVAGELPDVPIGDLVVIGCDSMLLIDGELKGKPAGAEQARLAWRQMAGRAALLITGHAVRRVIDGRVSAAAAGSRSSIVRMGTPTEREVDAYIATGEPMAVAGGLTIDGFGGWFVDGVDGDPSNVLGISLPLTRRLLAEIGISVTDLWRSPSSPA
jgi:septum formation protein